MADLSGSSEDLDKFIEAVRKATSSLSDGTNLADELRGEEKDRTRAVIKEFDKLGLSLKDHDKVVDKDTDSLKERAKNEKLVNDQLIASGKIRADATKEEIEAYKLTQKQNEAFRAQLEAMGKYLNETGKVIDSTVRLTNAQQTQVNKEKINSEKQNKQEQNKIELERQLATTFSATNLAGVALKAGFELLLAGVKGTYEGMLAMREMSLAGVEDDTKRAAGAAKVAESLAGRYDLLGNAAIAAAARLALLGGPLGLALGAVALAAGLAAKALALEKEEEARVGKLKAEQSKQLFLGFQKLSNASAVGADGITGLFNDLQKMGLTVSQFEKLNKVISGSTKELAMFGGTTITGAKEFSKQAGELLKSDFGKTLEIMGIGAEEQYQHQMSFMTIQTQFGLKVNGDVKKASFEYINQLDRLAILTGNTRKEQEADRKYLMSMNQLRAAIIDEERKGNKENVKELKRALEAATAIAAVDKQVAEGLAKFFAAGGAVDESSARASMVFGGAGGVIEQIKSGTKDITETFATSVKQLHAVEEKFASTTRMTGGISGVTAEAGGTGKIADAYTGLKAAEKAATENNKTIGGLLDFLKTNKDDATKLQVERMRLEREVNLAADKTLEAGYKFGDATKLQLQAAKDFISGSSIISMASDSLSQLFKKLIPFLSSAVSEGGAAVVGAAKGVASSVSGAAKGVASSVSGAASSALGGITSAVGGGAASGGAASGGAAPAASGGAAPAASGGAAPAAPAAASMQRMNLSVPNAAGPAVQGGSGRGGQGGASLKDMSTPAVSVAAANAELTKYAKISGANNKSLGFSALAENITKFESGEQGYAGTGYNAYNRGTIGNKMIGADKPIDFSKMTIAEYLKYGKLTHPKGPDGKQIVNPDKIFAVGKYQIIPATMEGLVKKLGLDPENTMLDKDTQDLLFNEGLIKQSRRNVANYLSGKSNDRDAAILDLAKEFASVGVPYPAGKAKERGESFYAGIGGNKAHNPPEAVGAALDADRQNKISAAMGGFTNGPSSGYPATLHGNEIITPLSPNSILEQLGKTTVASAANSIINSSSNSSTTNNNNDILNGLFDMMVSKLDTVIDKLDSGNDISKKIVKAMA